MVQHGGILSEESKAVWAKAVDKYRLLEPNLEKLLGNSGNVDVRPRAPPPSPGKGKVELPALMMHHSVKLRQAGFHDCIDTEDNFVDWLREMQRIKVLPPSAAGGGSSSKL